MRARQKQILLPLARELGQMVLLFSPWPGRAPRLPRAELGGPSDRSCADSSDLRGLLEDGWRGQSHSFEYFAPLPGETGLAELLLLLKLSQRIWWEQERTEHLPRQTYCRRRG